MKTIKIQGKDYVTVNERVKEFHKLYPKGSIQTAIITQTENEIVMKATVIPDCSELNRWFTGTAREVKGSGPVNKTSHFENCETSAVGRALGFLGIGIETDIASADEMAKTVTADTPISEGHIATLKEYIMSLGVDETRFLKYLKVDSFEAIMESQFSKALAALKSKAKGAKK